VWQNICREVQFYEAFLFLARLSLHTYFNSHKNPFTFCRVWSVGVMTLTGEKSKYSKVNLSSATLSTSDLTQIDLEIRIRHLNHTYMNIQFMLTEITVRVYYKHHPATAVQGNNCLGAFITLRKGTVSFVMSVCLSGFVLLSVRMERPGPSGRIIMIFYVRFFFNLSKEFKFY